MAKAGEITVDINVALVVSEKDANGLLWMVERYINANNLRISEHRETNGEVSLRYEPFG